MYIIVVKVFRYERKGNKLFFLHYTLHIMYYKVVSRQLFSAIQISSVLQIRSQIPGVCGGITHNWRLATKQSISLLNTSYLSSVIPVVGSFNCMFYVHFFRPISKTARLTWLQVNAFLSPLYRCARDFL